MPGTTRRLLWATLVLLGWLAGYAEARAALHCLAPVVKLGDVRAGVPLAHVFELVNRGREPLDIAEVRPSCGCLNIKLARRILGPGNFTSLRLEINTLTQPAGLQTWRVRLTWREGAKIDDLELSLTARVVAEVTVEPAALVVYTSAPIVATVTLRDRRDEPLSVARASTTSDRVQAILDKPEVDGTGLRLQKIRLRIMADYPPGGHDETLSLFTADPDYGELRVPFKVVMQAKSGVTAVPTAVTVTLRPGEAPPSRIILLRGPGEEKVEVERAESDHPAIRCTFAEGPGTMATLKISFDPVKMPAEGARGAVRVSLRGSKQSLTIPVSYVSP